jgi:hypothetical protein
MRLRADYLKGHYMHHIPHPKEQAKTLMQLAKARGWKLGNQDALEIVAEMLGFKSWQACSASIVESATQVTAEEVGPETRVAPCDAKEGKHLFAANVTADTTMTARLAVWATDRNDAIEKLIEFGGKLWKQADSVFEQDEGNQDADDVYLGDEDDIEELSSLEIDGDDMCACAGWADERASYRVWFTRDEPDHADDSRRSAVTVSLECTPNLKGAARVEKELAGDAGYVCSEDNLRAELRHAVTEGDFEDEFDKLLKKATRPAKRRPPQKRKHV